MVVYLDEIFGFIRIINKLRDVKSFNDWLFDFHKIKNNLEFFDGYLFLIIVCLRKMIDSISIDNSLDLEEDFIYNRAVFTGKFINDLPNSSEKIIFLKNIYNITKKVNRSKSWIELNQNLDYVNQNLFSKYEYLLENCLSINEKLSSYSLDNILDNLAIFNSYLFLIDTSHGKPKGYISILLKDKLTPTYLINSFKGYIYGLQYLFSSFLGSEFEKTSLTKLHQCYKPRKKLNKIEKNKIHYARRLWLCIDKYFPLIQEEIVEPIEKKINFRLGDYFSEPVFTPFAIPNKNKLKELIIKIPPEPSYLNKSDQKSIFKQLKLNLLWYPFKVLSGEYPIFTGVMSFIIVLNGNVTLKSSYDIKEKVEVIRFIHPLNNAKNNYSYAILIDNLTNTGLTDYSGWLIFYNCCNDFSGFGGNSHIQAEHFISLYIDKKLLNIREFRIPLDNFNKFLDENEERSYLRLTTQDNYESLKADIKGKFFESIVSYYLLKKGLDVKWAPKTEIAQIDIIAQNDDILYFYECKVTLGQKYLEIARKFLNKIEKLIEERDFILEQMKIDKITKYRIVLVIWNNLDSKRKKAIKKQFNIEIFDNFKRIFHNDRIFNQMDEKNVINQIFNGNSKSKDFFQKERIWEDFFSN